MADRTPATQVAPLTRLGTVVGAARVAHVRDALRSAARQLNGRRVWHVSANLSRGGVAEILNTVLPYLRSEGIPANRVSLPSSAEFRTLTKRLYYCLVGVAEPRVAENVTRQRALYEEICREGAARIVATAHRSDLIVVHDHQAAGLLPYLTDAGYTAIWRCHLNLRSDREVARRAWGFLAGYVEASYAIIVSTPSPLLSRSLARSIYVLPPSLDPFAAKNRPLPDACVDCIVGRADVAQPLRAGGCRTCRGLIGGPVAIVRENGPVPRESPLITQVSRWDKVKDIPGVIRTFVEHVDPAYGAHLALVGPHTAQDPHGHEVFMDCFASWAALSPRLRGRIHLIRIPVGCQVEHALIVNAIQRRSAVVLQRSLSEGFGLTVTEAGWKAKPVVASAVGGIACQLEHGKSGLLIPDLADLHAMGEAINQVMADAEYAMTLGNNARDNVRSQFLVDTHLHNVARVLGQVAG